MIWELAAGRELDVAARPHVMGILNVTPDSFFDGGRYDDGDRAIERALAMVEEGADILDVGGQSSRPPMYGALSEVSVTDECERVVPVIEGIRRHTDTPVSIDTTRAEVAREAVAAGADIVNDISAFTEDPGMAAAVASSGAAAVLMHRRGRPETMQQDTRYDDLLAEVQAYLAGRIDAAVAAGIPRQRLAVDPGLGFGKDRQGNLSLVGNVGRFHDLGLPVVIGASRKSFIWKSLGLTAAEALEGSLAVAVMVADRGVQILRVHDVVETVRALRMAQCVEDARSADARSADARSATADAGSPGDAVPAAATAVSFQS